MRPQAMYLHIPKTVRTLVSVYEPESCLQYHQLQLVARKITFRRRQIELCTSIKPHILLVWMHSEHEDTPMICLSHGNADSL